MSVGDVTSDHQSISDAARLTIQPAAGVEWVIHNLYYEGACNIHRTDGGNDLTFDTDTEAGARLGYVWHVTNTVYLELENVSGGSAVLGYDGVVTKEP
jgi:hypothetical protein